MAADSVQIELQTKCTDNSETISVGLSDFETYFGIPLGSCNSGGLSSLF